MDRLTALPAEYLFTFVDAEFYEPLARHPLSPEYTDVLAELLPDSWEQQRGDVWVHALRPRTSRRVAQGFKIHVSCTPAHALRALRIIAPVCVERGVEFKVAGDPALLYILNSKPQGRGNSGKFMTIYPPDEEIFKNLLEDLYQRTKDEEIEGPYILSDQRYKDSRALFYRYGGFLPARRLNIDGTQSTFLVSPSGEYLPDQRLPYFHLPDWIKDPFAGPFGDVTSGDHEGDAVLKDRYLIEGALAFSNCGGIYHGTDTADGKPVIIKEARPLTNCWSTETRSWDAVDSLKREYEVLRRLECLDFIPTPIDLFQDWEHTFLVEERLDGDSFNDYWGKEDVILGPYIRRDGRIERFLPRFKHVAESLIPMVAAVHGQGVLLGDLSPRNILIDPGTLRMWFIDFESAIWGEGDGERMSFSAQWGTPGFMHPERVSRNSLLPADDLYALGMVLYHCVVPVNMLFRLKPQAVPEFLDRFIELGVPGEVKAVVSSLLRGAPDEALDVLAGWKI
ncbi:class III lanthionine synthetase LanKC N-terminal domain-containing protein [Streptosporangium soli]|nr:hypothetical protein [Streptosporangium sp. KLBMP 9127]